MHPVWLAEKFTACLFTSFRSAPFIFKDTLMILPFCFLWPIFTPFCMVSVVCLVGVEAHSGPECLRSDPRRHPVQGGVVLYADSGLLHSLLLLLLHPFLQDTQTGPEVSAGRHSHAAHTFPRVPSGEFIDTEWILYFNFIPSSVCLISEQPSPLNTTFPSNAY